LSINKKSLIRYYQTAKTPLIVQLKSVYLQSIGLKLKNGTNKKYCWGLRSLPWGREGIKKLTLGSKKRKKTSEGKNMFFIFFP
jgi:hypothetical protein